MTKIFRTREGLKNLLGSSRRLYALKDITLNIQEGEIFGFIGPNGAGKTTLLKTLASLILPTTGQASIFGHDVVRESRTIRKLIGLIHSDERSFFWRLSGRQNLEFFAAIFQLPGQLARRRIDELLHLVELEDKADGMFHYYSTGMRQRLAIARGLLTHPKILFMDEGMRSVDPITTQKIRDFIRNEIYDLFGGTVILATNRLDEAAQLCDRIAVLHKGQILASGRLEELHQDMDQTIHYEMDVMNLGKETIEEISQMEWVRYHKVSQRDNGLAVLEFHLPSAEEFRLHAVLDTMMSSSARILRCSRKEPSIEAVFNSILQSEHSVKEDTEEVIL